MHLSLDELIRSIQINKKSKHSLFLGAGASISSGIPSANTCIWEWKRNILVSRNPNVADQFYDVSLPSIQEKIQRWIDSTGEFPPLESEDEYGVFVEKCYPLSEDRRRYFQSLVEKAQPYIGYKLLILLAKSGLINTVWSTNFDSLASKAASASSVSITPIEVGLDTILRLKRQPTDDELYCVSLHGDYRYDALKNTKEELTQDEALRKTLIDHLTNNNLIVCGYSGRDYSVMESLKTAFSRPGSGRLYWCGFEGEVPSGAINDLLKLARDNGREAFFIRTNGFDDLMERISKACLEGDLRKEAEGIHRNYTDIKRLTTPFSIESDNIHGLIKSNAFPIRCPNEVFQFEVQGIKHWKELKDKTIDAPFVTGMLGKKVLAIGNVDDIKSYFGKDINTPIERTPINEKELSFENGVIIHLLTSALIRSFAQSHGLESNGKNLVWDPMVSQTIYSYGKKCYVHDAGLFYLRRYSGNMFLVIKPTIKGLGETKDDIDSETSKELKRIVLTKQYNRQFNDAVEKWREFIKRKNVYKFPLGVQSSFRFQIVYAPVFTPVTSIERNKNTIQLPENQKKLLNFQAVSLNEPNIIFSDSTGSVKTTDSFPIKGMVQNKPFDYNLTVSGLNPSIRIGVVAPEKDGTTLSAFLAKLQQSQKVDSKREYLLPYPGFSLAFGLPINIPSFGQNEWISCEEPIKHLPYEEASVELGQRICKQIERLSARTSVDVTIVYIPKRWSRYGSFQTEKERFDLHDYVKAFCVQRGISTQFLREETIFKRNKCEILWWLSLSFYTKAMRTPWVLEGIQQNTAFLGLGYSVDFQKQKGEKILLGCSHIYDSKGLGLRYKLSKVENPIFRGKNPFLSKDDARRVAEKVRQLFYESLQSLPLRVVIHKRTPFIKQEKEGFLEGFNGIENVDMIEINEEPALRYVASKVLENRRVQLDGYPISRGTVTLLESKKALLWVHGSANSVDGNKNPYYLGKSRIPAPLVLKKHHGTSDLYTIANEILGLSKMDWNNFDLYSKLPATIQSSSKIARIGRLLERFDPISYDYRLFI